MFSCQIKRLFQLVIWVTLFNGQNVILAQKNEANEMPINVKRQFDAPLPKASPEIDYKKMLAEEEEQNNKANVQSKANVEQVENKKPEFSQAEVKKRMDTYFYQNGYENMQKEAEQYNKSYVLDFYTDWCRVCKQVDLETFANDEVKTLVEKNILILKANAEKEEANLAKKYGVEQFPTYIFFDHKGNELNRIVGYLDKEAFKKEFKKYKRIVPNTKYTKYR